MNLVPVASLGRYPRVVHVDSYDQGAVLWAWIDDEHGDRATVCIDGRLGSRTRHRLFEGDRHPARPRAKLIELGDPAEGLAIPLLSKFLDAELTGESRMLTEWGIELLQEALLRLGEPSD